MSSRSVTLFALTWVTFAATIIFAEDIEKRAPNKSDIDALISQLGSADFDAREAASAKLNQLDESAGSELESARAKSADPEIRQRLDEIIWHCAPWRGLVAQYREYGLPIADAGAELVRIPASRVQIDQKWVQRYYIGFLKDSQSQDVPLAQLLVGVTWQNVEKDSVELVPEDTSVMEFDMIDTLREFPLDEWLALSIQCEARGRHKLALQLQKTGDSARDEHLAGPTDLRSRLRILAWSYWARLLCTPDSDRPALIARMKEVMKKEPYLNKDKYRSFMACAEQTVVPGKSAAGSIEALMDGLTEVTTDSFFISEKLDPHIHKILARGFDAIPALIEHLDDSRLTRGSFPAVMNAPARGRRVQDVVRGILSGYGGGSANVDAWHDWSREWWARAKAVGEEAYLLDHVFPKDPRNEWPLPIILTVIELKFPRHLPSIYRNLLDNHPGLQSGPVCEAIACGNLQDSEKIKLFEYALEHKQPAIRHTALRYLKDLEPVVFSRALAAELTAMNVTTEGPYWCSSGATLAFLAIQTNDAIVWNALMSAAKKSDPGLRMELLAPMSYSGGGTQQLAQRVNLLGAFLDDHTIRDISTNPEKFEGPCAGAEYPIIEVGNFAALELAAILKVKPAPKPSWSATEWADLRKRVSDMLARR